MKIVSKTDLPWHAGLRMPDNIVGMPVKVPEPDVKPAPPPTPVAPPDTEPPLIPSPDTEPQRPCPRRPDDPDPDTCELV